MEAPAAPAGGLPPLEAAERARTGPLAGPGPGRGLASNRPLRVRPARRTPERARAHLAPSPPPPIAPIPLHMQPRPARTSGSLTGPAARAPNQTRKGGQKELGASLPAVFRAGGAEGGAPLGPGARLQQDKARLARDVEDMKLTRKNKHEIDQILMETWLNDVSLDLRGRGGAGGGGAPAARSPTRF